MKIGFIGVGGIADNYLGSLAKLERPVAAVCDVNPKRTEEVANRLGAKPYADYKQMLADNKLDIVFVCVPLNRRSPTPPKRARTCSLPNPSVCI